MEYNTQREKIKITDYGRNVYKLIAYVKTIEDREKGTQWLRRLWKRWHW